MAKKKAAAVGGAMGQQAKGRRTIQLWLDQADFDLITRAANEERSTKTNIVVRGALDLAKKILKKAGTSIDSL